MYKFGAKQLHKAMAEDTDAGLLVKTIRRDDCVQSLKLVEVCGERGRLAKVLETARKKHGRIERVRTFPNEIEDVKPV